MKKITKIYCDFDGTITKLDTVNAFYEKFADKSWTDSEELWVAGKITSLENTTKQVSLLRELSQKELDDFVDSVELTEGFLDFVKFLNEQKIELVILSDGFDYFIKEVLKKHNITNVKYYANHLVYKNNKFSIEFPYYNNECLKGAGMCKCDKVKEPEYCYIGDGTSDLCVAKKASMLFATKSLCKFCVTNSINHVKFETFSDIIENVRNINGVLYGNVNTKSISNH